MNLKKLYADALLGKTLREFRKGRKYIAGHGDESGEDITKDKRYLRSYGSRPNAPRLIESTGSNHPG